jgi:hypothetical protein
MNHGHLILAAQEEVLQSLLQYEGVPGSTLYNASGAKFNDVIAGKAKELGLELDWSQTGRGAYGGKI